jgi:hypothetical protein
MLAAVRGRAAAFSPAVQRRTFGDCAGASRGRALLVTAGTRSGRLGSAWAGLGTVREEAKLAERWRPRSVTRRRWCREGWPASPGRWSWPACCPASGSRRRRPCMTWRRPYDWWRWRESNPRPSVHHQGFSGRSLLCFSQPRRSRKLDADRLSRCSMSRLAPRPGQAVILLADARHRVEGIPGLTDLYFALSGKSEISARCVGTYWFAVTGFTRSQPQPSARFPWFNHRSRNRSPPIELYGQHGTYCRTRPYTYNRRQPTPIPGLT